jgi:hypothetical protein
MPSSLAFPPPTTEKMKMKRKNIKENPAPKSKPKAVLGYLKME